MREFHKNQAEIREMRFISDNFSWKMLKFTHIHPYLCRKSPESEGRFRKFPASPRAIARGPGGISENLPEDER